MSEPWLHQTVNVNVSSVQDFALRVQAEFTDNFTPSLSEGVQPMLSAQPSYTGGLNEGEYFRGMHQKHVKAAMYLINDVTLGLQALSRAAAAVATEYAYGDALSEATVDDVYESFIPTAEQRDQSPTEEPDPLSDPTAELDLPPEVTDPDAYESSGSDDGEGEAIAEGGPGEFEIRDDDERVFEDVDPIPQPRG